MRGEGKVFKKGESMKIFLSCLVPPLSRTPHFDMRGSFFIFNYSSVTAHISPAAIFSGSVEEK